MPWNDFSYKQNTYSRKPGVYRCVILNAEITESKSSGLPMIRIELRPSGTAANVYAYIVGNDHFDENYSGFLDAFPQIKDAGFPKEECARFRGAEGCVRLTLDDNGYFKAHKYPWIRPDQAANLPPFVWKYRDDEPARQPEFDPSADLTEIADDSGGTLPF